MSTWADMPTSSPCSSFSGKVPSAQEYEEGEIGYGNPDPSSNDYHSDASTVDSQENRSKEMANVFAAVLGSSLGRDLLTSSSTSVNFDRDCAVADAMNVLENSNDLSTPDTELREVVVISSCSDTLSPTPSQSGVSGYSDPIVYSMDNPPKAPMRRQRAFLSDSQGLPSNLPFSPSQAPGTDPIECTASPDIHKPVCISRGHGPTKKEAADIIGYFGSDVNNKLVATLMEKDDPVDIVLRKMEKKTKNNGQSTRFIKTVSGNRNLITELQSQSFSTSLAMDAVKNLSWRRSCLLKIDVLRNYMDLLGENDQELSDLDSAVEELLMKLDDRKVISAIKTRETLELMKPRSTAGGDISDVFTSGRSYDAASVQLLGLMKDSTELAGTIEELQESTNMLLRTRYRPKVPSRFTGKPNRPSPYSDPMNSRSSPPKRIPAAKPSLHLQEVGSK